jgi:hypothetical protein
MLVGCVSFDWHPGRLFLTSKTHVVISFVCLCLILSTPLALSPQKLGHSCSDNNTHSLSLLRRSLAGSVCSDVPTGLSRSPPPGARAEDCATAKGARADVDRHPPCLRSSSSTVLGSCRKSSSRWKLIGPFY